MKFFIGIVFLITFVLCFFHFLSAVFFSPFPFLRIVLAFSESSIFTIFAHVEYLNCTSEHIQSSTQLVLWMIPKWLFNEKFFVHWLMSFVISREITKLITSTCPISAFTSLHISNLSFSAHFIYF